MRISDWSSDVCSSDLCPWDGLVDGTHADDLAGRGGDLGLWASAQELSHCFPGAEELAVEVDREHAPPLAEGHFLKAPAGLDPRIVDQNMHRAEPGDGFLEHRLNVLLVGDVGGDCGGATAFAFDLPDYPGRRRSEARRVGKECVSTGRVRWSRY